MVRDWRGVVAQLTLLVSLSGASSSLEECDRELSPSLSPSSSALVRCDFLDERWVDCALPVDASSTPPNGGGQSNHSLTPNGACTRWGGSRHEPLLFTNVNCTVLPCIECRGPREFLRSVPCIRYTGHYFLATLLYSMFLGILAVDRFCLGYSAIAVGKLMTLGGLGVWWIVDVFLLVSGSLGPADGSSWMPYF